MEDGLNLYKRANGSNCNKSQGDERAFERSPGDVSNVNNGYYDGQSQSTDKSLSDMYKMKGININEATIEQLRLVFEASLPVSEPQSTLTGFKVKKLDPFQMKSQFLKLGMDLKQPSMFKMMSQLERYCKKENLFMLSFQQFMGFAVEFFSQRDS